MAERKQHGRRLLAGVLVALVLAGGGYCAGVVSQRMAAATRSGQPAAVFRAGNGRLEYSLLGREGVLPYAAWGEALVQNLTTLPAKGRLLYWGVAAADAEVQERLLPVVERVIGIG